MIKFGTGGWRALIAEEFTQDNVRILAQALADYISSEGKSGSEFVIGRDRRFLSDKASYWLSEVMAANGFQVKLIDDAVPTPVVMFSMIKHQIPFGACITASHNPAEYNGIKVFTAGGRDATEDVTDGIERFIANTASADVKSIPLAHGLANGSIERVRPMNEFLDSILEKTNIEVIRNANLKVLVDPMYGVAKHALLSVLYAARCNVDVIHERKDPDFGGRMPSPSLKTLRRLSDTLVERGYDLGIATDGDADRLGIIDDKGRYVHPNEIMVLLYLYLVEYKKEQGGVVRNLATTHLLDRMAKAYGQECYEVPVGFKHVSAKMDEQDAVLGGESSGGLTIRGHIKGKDGILAAAMLVELVCASGKSLSQLLEETYQRFGYLYMVEGDCTYAPEDKPNMLKRIFEDKEVPDLGYDIERINYMDGMKVYFSNGGWVIARFSGTEPLLRIFSEMPTLNEAESVLDKMKAWLTV